MKLSKLAALVVVGALVTPLASFADDKPAGTAKVWVNAEGFIVRYEVVSLMKGETKKGPVEVTITKTVDLSERGTTKVEVPEGAAKLLNSQS